MPASKQDPKATSSDTPEAEEAATNAPLVHLDSPDELAVGKLLGMLRPWADTKALAEAAAKHDASESGDRFDEAVFEARWAEWEKLVVQWTKYERVEGTRPVNVGSEMSMVAIQSPSSGAIKIIMRQLVDTWEIPDSVTPETPDGKTFRKYEIVATRDVDEDDAVAFMRSLQKAYQIKLARDMEGFGRF